MEKNTARDNFIYGVILFLFSLLAIVESIKMPNYSHRGEGIYVAPGLVPLLLGLALLAMAAAVLIKALKAGGWQQFKQSIANRKREKSNDDGRKNMQLSLLYIGIYVFLLLGRIPYIVSTLAFLFVFIYSFDKGDKKKRIIKSTLISVITTAIIFILFSKVFMIRLP